MKTPATYTVEALDSGEWTIDASGFPTRAAALRYIRACRFWDAFTRRVAIRET